jgi:acetyl-CoA acetyltransferase
VAQKNHKHSVNNPKSQFQDEYSLEDILKSAKIHDPLTKLQCCPTSDGSAAAIVASEQFVLDHGLQNQVCLSSSFFYLSIYLSSSSFYLFL